MNTETNTQNETVAAAAIDDPTLAVTVPRPAPMNQRELRQALTRLENNVQKRLRAEGLYNTIAGRALRNALNAFLNRSTHPMAGALHVALAVDAELRTSIIAVGLDRSALGDSQNPNDTGSLDLDPDLLAERHTRVIDQPFLTITSAHLPEGSADLPETDRIGMGLVPQGMAGLEQQTQQLVQQYPDRGLLTFFQALTTFVIDSLWRSEQLRKNLKTREFLPHVRLYQLDPTGREIRFVFDVGTRVQEDGLIEQRTGEGEDAKVEMVPGKVWRFTGECERITVSIDPLRMYESARIDQWYPEYYKRFDEAMERAAEEQVAAAAAAAAQEREPEEVAAEDEGVYRWSDAVILPLGRPTLAGRVFPPELLAAQLAEGGQLRGLIERDTVYGEYTAPRRAPHVTDEEWVARVRTVELDNVAVKIENLRINDAGDALVGDIIPFGNHAGLPIRLIKGGETPVVAMRSFTVLDKNDPKRVSELRAVVAFDLVANTSTPEMMDEIRQNLRESGALAEEPKPVDPNYVEEARTIVGLDPAAPGSSDFSPDMDPVNVADAIQVESFDGQSK